MLSLLPLLKLALICWGGVWPVACPLKTILVHPSLFCFYTTSVSLASQKCYVAMSDVSVEIAKGWPESP